MKKLISIILASVMLSGTAAGAIELQDDWVNVSAWAYNDVSNFTNEGLLPECFEGVTDYRVPITREQFAELAYNVYSESNDFDDTLFIRFDDCDSYAVNMLGCYGVVLGTDDYDRNGLYSFFPDRKITREDAAVIAYRTGQFNVPNLYEYDDFGNRTVISAPGLSFIDASEISDYAAEAVWYLNSIGVVSGTDKGAFEPKADITIEQAISLLYRLYQNLPAVPKADGAAADSNEETLLKTFDNGFTETHLGNMLYINHDGKKVMSFETDMYFNLNCVSLNGKDYILARNFKKRTEVYDAGTKKRLFTVPCPVSKVKNGCMYTVSSDKGEYLCGLYNFEGKEILPNKYSEHEVDRFIANNFSELKTGYRAPDGWIYYSDAENGYLYRVDSNGENDRLILEKEATDIHYAGDWLYFITPAANLPLCAVRPDGSSLTVLSETPSWLIRNEASKEYVSSDGYVYYTAESEYEHYTYKDDEGNIVSEDMAFDTLWRAKPTENGFINEQVSDIFTGPNPILYNNKVFFLDKRQLTDNRETPLLPGNAYVYCFDGKETRCVLEKRVSEISVREDENGVLYLSAQTYDSGNEYKINLNSLKCEPINDNFSAYHPSEKKTDEYVKISAFSDESYTFYRNYLKDSIAFSGTDGEIVTIETENAPNVFRFKNIIYYTKMFVSDGGEGLYAYDMDKRERVKITDDFDRMLQPLKNENKLSEGSAIVYADRFGNIYRLDAGSYEPVQIYPNSGADRYSKPKSIVETSYTDGLKKLGENNIYSKLTDKPVRSWCYVENGREKKFIE